MQIDVCSLELGVFKNFISLPIINWFGFLVLFVMQAGPTVSLQVKMGLSIMLFSASTWSLPMKVKVCRVTTIQREWGSILITYFILRFIKSSSNLCWGFTERVQEVLDFLFQYIKLLQQQGVVVWIFEEVLSCWHSICISTFSCSCGFRLIAFSWA